MTSYFVYIVRANGLESALREKDAAIDALRRENDDLRHASQEEREHVRAQTVPETQDLQHVVDDLRRQLDERNAQLDAASHQRNDFEWSLGEHKQWLGDANRRVGELSDELNEKNRIIDDLNRQIREMKQSMHETLTYDEAEELRERCEFLETELHEATFLLKEVENLADVRAGWLEHVVGERDATIDALRKENDELKAANEAAAEAIAKAEQKTEPEEFAEKVKVTLAEAEKAPAEVPTGEDTSALKAEIDRLVNEISEKNRLIDELNKVKNDAEWSLGEHKQWLSDANNRANGLENARRDKDAEIDALKKEVSDLKIARPEVSEGREGELDDLRRALHDLEEKLHQAQQTIADAPKPEELRATAFENALREKDQRIGDLQHELDDLRTAKIETPDDAVHTEIAQLNAKIQDLEGKLRESEKALGEAPKTEEIKLFFTLNAKIQDLEGKLRESEKALGEAPKTEEIKANGLESACKDKDATIDTLRRENEELKTLTLEIPHGALPDEGEEVAKSACKDKDATIDTLRRENEELKTLTLETPHGALSDEGEEVAKNFPADISHCSQANGLESACKDKDATIDTLRRENEELKTLTLEIPHGALPDEGEEVAKLHDNIKDLQNRLLETEQTLAAAPKSDDIRANGLENAVKDKDELIGSLRKEVDELRAVKIETPEDAREDEIRQASRTLKHEMVPAWKGVISGPELITFVLDELRAVKIETPEDAREDEIRQLRESIQDLEGKLNDSQKALADAPKPDEIKANDLERAVREKDVVIDDLRKENDELLTFKLEALGSGDVIKKLHEYVENLESQLRNSRNEIEEAPKREELEANGLENAIKEKDTIIDALRKENEDLKNICQQPQELEEKMHQLAMQTVESAREQPIAMLQTEVEVNALEGTLAEKDRAIESLRKEVDELKMSKVETPGDVECQQLRERVEHLETKLHDAEHALNEAVKTDLVSTLESTINGLKNELADKNTQIEHLSKERNDAEWHLGEYKQWLADANKRTLESTINGLKNELADKNTQIEHLSKERNDAEWHLGEYKQWLADANKRNEELSNSLKEKEDAVKALRAAQNEVIYIEEIVKTERFRPAHRSTPSPSYAESNSMQLKARIDELERKLKEVDVSAQSSIEAREGDEHRIAELEQEISKLRDSYESALKSARTEVYELHEKNIKLEETLKKTEIIVVNLQKEKEATRRSLIPEQPSVEFKDREELEQEIIRLRERYVELSNLLKCTDELLAKLQAETPDTADMAINELEGEIKKLKAENEGVQQSLRARIQQLEESALNKAIQDLRHELNYQKVIDTLTDQKKDTEKSLAEQAKLLNDAYKKINELEDLLSKSAEERDEARKDAIHKSVELLQKETEITKTLQEDETRVRVERTAPQEGGPSSEEIRNSQMSGELAEKQHTIDVLNGEKEQLRHEIDALNDKIKELSTTGHSDTPSEETRELETKLREKDDQLHRAIAEIDEKEEEITANWLEGELNNTKGDAGSKQAQIDDLRRKIAEKDSEIVELHNKIEQAASSTPTTGPERELTPNEEELRMLQAKLRNAVEKSELLQNQLDDARMQIVCHYFLNVIYLNRNPRISTSLRSLFPVKPIHQRMTRGLSDSSIFY
uniref:TPR_MLP1_2 domain-containing protein n=1 Tax=Ascaris lumbricoides TaxID=6252 RepID=A0A0M3I2T5_ASCLU